MSPSKVPADACNLAQTHLRNLLNVCDVTAAAFGRFLHKTFFLSVIPDFEQWREEVGREYEKLLAVAARMFSPAEKVFHALACVQDMNKHALNSLRLAGQGGPHPELDAVTGWLLTMWNVGESFPAPSHDRFHLFHGEAPEWVAKQSHERRLQLARLTDYQLNLRSGLVGLFTLARNAPPDDTAHRRRWFGGNVGMEVIGDEELFGWLTAVPPSVTDVPETTLKKPRKLTQEDTNVAVREWFKRNAAKVNEKPEDVTRDGIAEEINAHAPYVSNAPRWIIFREDREKSRKPGKVRTVPNGHELLAVLPDAVDHADELAELIANDHDTQEQDGRYRSRNARRNYGEE